MNRQESATGYQVSHPRSGAREAKVPTIPRWAKPTLVLSLLLLLSISGMSYSQQVLRVGTSVDAVSLDVHTSGAVADRIPLHHVLETLVTINDEYEVVPLLASSWETNDAGTEYVFHLRSGLKFHDGTDLTSADVVYSFERFLQISPRRNEFTAVASVTADDDFTIRVSLREPSAPFLSAVANPHLALAIFPEGMVEAQGGSITHPIGTGPFEFVEWIPDVRYRIKRFSGYQAIGDSPDGFGGNKTGLVDMIDFIPMIDTDMRINALEAGEIDFATDIPPDQVIRLANLPGIQTHSISSATWGIMYIGHEYAPTDDRNFRLAVAHAIDKEELADVAFWGTSSAATSAIPEESAWYSDVHATDNAYDPELARQYLAQSTYDGSQIVLPTTSAYEYIERTVIVLSQQLNAVGIRTRLEPLEWAAYVNRITEGNLNILVVRQLPRPDPHITYSALLHSSVSLTKYNNPEMDELLEKGATESDFTARKAIYEAIYRLILEDVPFITLYWQPVTEAHATGLEGYVPNGYGYPRFWGVSLKN